MKGNSVGGRTSVGRRGEFLPHLGNQCIQFAPEYFMIIVAPGVTRNPSTRRFFFARFAAGYFGRIWLRRVVVNRANNHALHAVHRSLQISASRIVQVIHLPCKSALKPIVQLPKLGKFHRWRNATQIKSKRPRGLRNPGSIGGGFRSYAHHIPILSSWWRRSQKEKSPSIARGALVGVRFSQEERRFPLAGPSGLG